MMLPSGGVKPYLRIALIAHTPTMLGNTVSSVGTRTQIPVQMSPSSSRCAARPLGGTDLVTCVVHKV
eukprot:scaffold8758_cov154-Skeletonema_menzelii.AAC.1